MTWFNSIWLVLCFTSIVHQASAATIQVQNPAELSAALINTNSGDIIRLAPGNYGVLTLKDRVFTQFVTLESSNKSNPAVFSHIEIEASRHLRIDALKVVAESREGIGIFASSDVDILNSQIHGKNQFNRQAPVYTQVSTLYGINVGEDSSDIVVEGNSVSDVRSAAYIFFGVREIAVDANRCDWVAADCFKFGGVDQASVTNNFGAQHIYAAPSAHVDFMQGQGPVSNAVFRGNVAMMGSRSFQGLFFDDADFENLLFEDNLIYTAHNRGISVSAGRGIRARYNTVLRAAGSQKATYIALPSGSDKAFNFEANNTFSDEERFPATNIVAQWDKPQAAAHYSRYYQNAMHGAFAQIADFTPVAGSVADGQVGAFRRIRALLQGNDRRSDAVLPPFSLLLDD
ncbi:hypothetical protein GCM10008090_00750 [Arenicella chitinivorans]|uniref:Right handed beta helix domain-containing protein n=1 Tax=Arenicella chitinivorans TaxID=1329800 RepID=A0A918RF61_9GAMM|nr:right-handed parallel beta-helix repeat-containing protein [Arenicella chitinivorans]GGZ96370.1 hypothetical protein GCM10008090_00750 [Arenicella chitinivorans]